jgi:RNA processing factor Prp31
MFSDQLSKIISVRANDISKLLNNVACDKDQAMLEFTRVNNAVAKLPDDIVKVWQDYDVDFSILHKNLENECRCIERMNNARLVTVQRMVLQAEYAAFVKNAATQFKYDVLAASPEQKDLMLEQSINLLDTVDPSTKSLSVRRFGA